MSDPQFPDDENGDVLRSMAARGVDLISPRMMEFEHVFPDEAATQSFVEAVGESFASIVRSPAPSE